MEIFFSNTISNDKAILDREESRHAIKVLRLRKGNKIELTDGKGTFYTGEIETADPDECIVAITETLVPPVRDYRIHIAIAPTKNIDRFEWFLEKATEFGIDMITPLLTKRTERNVIKPERLQKILISAMKQSGQAVLPVLNPLSPFKDLLGKATDEQKFIAHCVKGQERKTLFKSAIPSKDAMILIGPEGDFTEEEIAAALQAGFKPVSLGNTRLRTETAGLAAVQSIHFINGLNP